MAGADKESFAGDKSGAAVSKIPGMLKEHGILWPEQEAEEARRQSLGKTALANTLRPKPFAHLSISIPDDHRAFFFFFFFYKPLDYLRQLLLLLASFIGSLWIKVTRESLLKP